MRPTRRNADQLREISLTPDVSKHAEGSCLAKFGDTHVLCTASVEQKVPGWMRGSGQGWVTAEYGMLPRSTTERMGREAARGKQSGRTQEIQRLIGRSLRAVCDMKAMGELQVRIDCDVIQADGGTRTAAITGAYVALYRAFERCRDLGILESIPLTAAVAAISCGIYKGEAVLDLDYDEDSNAETDANFVLTDQKAIIEIQGTAEAEPFSRTQFLSLLDLAEKGVSELTARQRDALKISGD